MNTNPRTHCLDDEVLAAYADGALTGDARDAAEMHLADCADCRAAARELAEFVNESAEAVSASAPPADLADRILARIPVRRSTKEGVVLQFVKTAAAIAAVALVAVGVASLDAGSHDSSSNRGGWAGLPAAARADANEVQVPARPENLGGDERYLAYLSTDKPLYRPGERVMARAVLLDAFDRKPLGATQNVGNAVFEVRSGRGEKVAEVVGTAENGVAAFGWEVPVGQAGGTFTLKARFPWGGFPESETTFDVRDYRVPRLKTDVQFVKKAYGPGDQVLATLEATRAEGGVPVAATVAAVARVDGKEVFRKEGLALENVDGAGRLTVSFALPSDIAVGDGTLALVIRDGGVSETAAKTIPIVVNKVAISFYPEGGDLVAGVPCRVYFEARTPKQAPADVSGRVLDADGRAVARFDSFHEGRGRLEFTPNLGVSYRVALDRPSGIAETIALPEVRPSGFAVAALSDGVAADEPVRVAVASPTSTAATVVLYQRERELSMQLVRLEGGKPVAVTLAPNAAASGVLRVTVYDAVGVPRAERLVFRRPAKSLKIEAVAESDAVAPGGRVRVSLLAKDDRGRPVQAVIGLAATDDAVLATIDPRERAPRLPVQALLGAEVRELKDAHLYLGVDSDSARRTDLLLGTQGWRKFGFTNVEAFAKDHDLDAARALAWRAVVEERRTVSYALAALPAGGAPPPAPGAPPVAPPEWKPAVALEGLLLLDGVENLKAQDEFLAPKNFMPPEDARLQAFVLLAGETDNDMPAVGEAGVRREAQFREWADDMTLTRNLDHKKLAWPDKQFWGRLSRARAGLANAVAAPAWARLFAHAAPEKRVDGARSDFTETVYWNAGLPTDADGRASFTFDASDAVTTVRVRADAFAADGALGSADATIEVRRPFYVEPKLPLEVTAGDRIDLPVAIVNGTVRPLKAKVTTDVDGGLRLRVVLSPDEGDAVAAHGSLRIVPTIDVGTQPGLARIHLRALADVYTDDVTRQVRVVPAGFPLAREFGGVLEHNVEHSFSVPADVLPGSVATEGAVYPTPLSSLTQALEGLLREPCGCFEQTSSSNYPNVMALQYLKSHAGVDPALVKRASDLLARGYQRLVGYECRQQGYEWFGGDPGHEALTAYGVMEFTDMASVMNVDAEMLARTRAWLLSRRDGKGGFQRNAAAIDSFGRAPEDVTNAYILWALAEAGQQGMEKEIAALKEVAARSADPYLLALAANVLRKSSDLEGANAAIARLADTQTKDGAFGGAKTSITGSGGESLDVEATSLAILAMLPAPDQTARVEKAMRWLAERCKSGRFGSTQATILALKAIVAYDARHARPKSPGTITVTLDGQVLATVAFPADQQGPIALPDLGDKIGAGPHALALAMEGGADMPYSFSVRCHALTPNSSPATKVEIATSIAKTEVGEGEPVEVPVTVRNRTDEGVPMVVAIVGIPGGVEPRAEALKELVKQGKVDAFETRGREVILYWRGIGPKASKDVVIACIAAVPGSYTGPASRAYLYYTDEHKVWAAGLKVSIKAR